MKRAGRDGHRSKPAGHKRIVTEFRIPAIKRHTAKQSTAKGASARQSKIPQYVLDACDALYHDGTHVVEDGSHSVHLGVQRFGHPLRVLAGLDLHSRIEAENLWAVVRRLSKSEIAFNAEARYILALLPTTMIGAGSAHTRSDLRAHDRALAGSAKRLRDELLCHPDLNVRDEPSTSYWPTEYASTEFKAFKIKLAPHLYVGIRTPPPLWILLSEFADQMEARAAVRVTPQQHKRKQQGKWALENRVVNVLAPLIFARYRKAKPADVAWIILGLAVACLNSHAAHADVLKQVQRVRIADNKPPQREHVLSVT